MRPQGPVAESGTLAHKIAEIYLKDKISKSKEHIAIRLDPKTLDIYTGQYKWINTRESWIEVSGESFTIYQKDDHLFGRGKVGDLEIFAEGENQFFMKDKSTLKFIFENNKVTGLVLDAMGLGVVIVNAQKVD
jgi:hypothetical protein